MPLDFDPIAEAKRNWVRAGWSSAGAMVVATSITRAHQIVLSRINDVLAPHGLNFSRFEALALLRFSRAGALPLGKMGDRLQVHAASVTNTIDRLERDGLVERVPHPTDGRTTLASITPAGSDLVEEAQQALGSIDFGLTGLGPDDLEALEVHLRELRHQAGDF